MGKHDPSAPITETERTTRQEQTAEWFRTLRDQICDAFEAIENEYAADHPEAGAPGRFNRKSWDRPEGGGGIMSLMHGLVFEKVGVNISTVHGHFSEEFKGQIPGTADNPAFWASGISLVAHMRNPFVPAVHMNTRYLNTGGTEGKRWFGGGADLTPIMPDEDDITDFHARLKTACDAYDPEYYPAYKAWCDEYFYLAHRDEPRGAGGIFYDYLDEGDFDGEFAFTREVGQAFLDIYPLLVRRRMETPFTDADRQYQLIRRGRYVEFNLLYDRGTVFGLKTGGNVEAILMSLPPEVRWP
ncbi:oxygen-dependent coproporphyrinogen oxidase [Alphaproteobacteria bacterium LSUCC0684]